MTYRNHLGTNNEKERERQGGELKKKERKEGRQMEIKRAKNL
jgi:hypothetical protein